MDQAKLSLEEIYHFFKINENFTLPVLKGIDIKIMPQDLIGILGPSGSGKTTLLKILIGDIKPTAGKFTIGTSDLVNNPRFFQNEIGYLPQDPSEILITELNVADWLSFIELHSNFNSITFNLLKTEIMHDWGINEFTNQKIEDLSGGQKQRVGLLSILLKGCDILLLDEPTAMLHREMSTKVINTIKNYIDKFHGCAIVVTHSFEIATKCTQIFELFNGSIRLTGEFDEETYVGNYQNGSFQLFIDKWGRLLIPNSLVDVLGLENEVFLTYMDESLKLTKGR